MLNQRTIQQPNLNIELRPGMSYDQAWEIVFKNGNFTSNELELVGRGGLPTTGKITAIGVGLGIHYESNGTGSYVRVLRDKDGKIKPLYYVEINNKNWYYYEPGGNIWVLTTKPLLFHRGNAEGNVDVGKDIDCGKENWDAVGLESAKQSWVALYSAMLRIKAMEGMDFESYKEQINDAMNWFKEQENKAEGEEKEQYKAVWKYLGDVLANINNIEERWNGNAILVPGAVSWRVVRNGREEPLVWGVMLVKNKETGEFFSPELNLIGNLDKIAQAYARGSGGCVRILTTNSLSTEFYSPPKEIFWELVGELTGVKDIEEFIYNPSWRTALPATITIIEYALLIGGVGGVGRIAEGTRAGRILKRMGLSDPGLRRFGSLVAFNAIVLEPLKQAPKDPVLAIANAIFGIALWYVAYEQLVGKALVNAPTWIKTIGNLGALGAAVSIDIAVSKKFDELINSKEINPEALKQTINGVILALETSTELTSEDYIALQGLLEACILAYIYCKLKANEKVSSEEIKWINSVISDARGILKRKGIDPTPLTELLDALEKMGFGYTSLIPKKEGKESNV